MRPTRKTVTAGPARDARAARHSVLYARVSSKDQEREGFSIPAQLQLLRGYAASRGLTVLKEFVDVETAKQAGRTGFGEMLAFLRKEKTCRILLVEKESGPHCQDHFSGPIS
jgi:site-specific DNA recombinase